MELTAENSNYIKLSYIILDVIAKHLRKYFIKLWDAKYPDEKWKDAIDKKNHKFKSLLIKDKWKLKMLSGSEQDWDTSTLLDALLDSKHLKLMQDGSNEKKDIDNIRLFYNHLLSPSWSDTSFSGQMKSIKRLSKKRFGEDAEKEIGDIQYSQVTPEMKKQVEQQLKGIKPTLKAPTEKENYVRLAYVLLNVVAKHLRRYFIKLWDEKRPSEKWDGINNKKAKLQKLLVGNIATERMLDGNEENWDTTTLLHAILDSGLKLMEGRRPHTERSLPLLEGEQIDIIRDIRNSHYGHFLCMSCSDEKFKDIMADIKCVAKERFGEEAEKEIVNIETSPITSLMKKEMKLLIDKFKHEMELLTKGLSGQIEKFQEVLSAVKTLRYKMNKLDKGSMRKVSELCGHLSSTFKCNDKEIKETLKNILVKEVWIADVKSLTCVKYLPNVERITLNGMKIKSSFHIRSEANAVAKCKDLTFGGCQFADDGIMENNMAIKDHQLNELRIEGCKLNKYSFINVCNWALASVNTFWLWYMDNIEHSWWGELVDAIQNAKEKNNGILALRRLYIRNCTQKMSKEMQMKILQCGVQLMIDLRIVKLPLQLDNPERDLQSYNQKPSLPPPVPPSYSSSTSKSTRPQPAALPSMSTSSSSTSTRPPQADDVLLKSHAIATNLPLSSNVATPGGLTPSTSDGSHHPQLTDDIEDWVVIDVCDGDNGRNVSCSTYRSDDNKESPPAF